MNGVKDAEILKALKETLSLNDYPAINQLIYYQEVYLMCLYATDETVEKYIKKFPHLTFKRWHPFVLNVLQEDVSKSLAIKKVLKYFDIDKSEAIAFGDGENDIDMVELVGTPVVSDISLRNRLGTKAIDADKMARVDSSDPRKIKVTNINLYGNQEIEINYKIRLKTEASSFTSGSWYPANGKTVLHSMPNRTEDKLDFGVPSVRAFNEDFVIPVKKVLSDDENNRWKMRIVFIR